MANSSQVATPLMDIHNINKGAVCSFDVQLMPQVWDMKRVVFLFFFNEMQAQPSIWVNIAEKMGKTMLPLFKKKSSLLYTRLKVKQVFIKCGNKLSSTPKATMNQQFYLKWASLTPRGSHAFLPQFLAWSDWASSLRKGNSSLRDTEAAARARRYTEVNLLIIYQWPHSSAAGQTLRAACSVFGVHKRWRLLAFIYFLTATVDRKLML